MKSLDELSKAHQKQKVLRDNAYLKKIDIEEQIESNRRYNALINMEVNNYKLGYYKLKMDRLYLNGYLVVFNALSIVFGILSKQILAYSIFSVSVSFVAKETQKYINKPLLRHLMHFDIEDKIREQNFGEKRAIKLLHEKIEAERVYVEEEIKLNEIIRALEDYKVKEDIKIDRVIDKVYIKTKD